MTTVAHISQHHRMTAGVCGKCRKSVCLRVYAVVHILSPVQIKPLPMIRSNDKQEDGGAQSPDRRLEGPSWHKVVGGWVERLSATTPVCTITNPAVAGRHYRSAPWPSHKHQRFDIYTRLTCLRPYLLKRAQSLSSRCTA